MADLSKVKVGTTYYNLKDAAARESIAAVEASLSAEVIRATGVESGLDTRITNLEARGRFLSNYDVATGLPTTYPEVPSGQSTYTYTFKSGDYYIVGNVPASGDKYMPDGSSISYDASKDPKWTVGKKKTTDAISTGDQFVFDGTNWVHIAAAKDVAWGQIVGTLSDQTDLQGALDLKQDAADLKALAFKASASGSTTLSTVDSITMKSVTVSGNAAVTSTKTAADLTKVDYTPAGTVTGTVTALGSVAVTLKDAAAKTSADITYDYYTPAGTISATTSGTFAALKTATLGEVSAATEGAIQVEGTISKPAITVNDDTVDTFVKSLKAGTVDAAAIDTSKFSGGSFTGATQASFTQGAKASFTQGAKASFTKGTAISATTEGIVASVNASASASDPDFECLILSAATTHDVIGHTEASFTANGDDTFTANGDDSFTANSVGSFTAAAIQSGFFSAEKLPVVDGTGSAVTAVTAELAETPAFTGKYYKNATTTDTALKEVAFAGTSAQIKATAVEYLKQEVSAASFTGSSANITASFAGEAKTSFIVTGVSYNAPNASAAFSVDITPEVSAITSSAKTINITVE